MQTHIDWEALSETFAERVRGEARAWISEDERHFERTMTFALGRLSEGRGIGAFLIERFPGQRLRCLDLGAGGGGVSLGLGNYRQLEVHAVDVIPNQAMVELREATRLPIEVTVGTGESLPYADASFDVVLCLETIEHVHRPDDLGREIMRILRPGGLCMITTPPRLRYLFKPDPHYGVRGLLLLPDALQPMLARAAAGVRLYDVVHIFWSVDGITKHFPGGDVEVFWDHPRPFAQAWKNDWWWKYRFHLWDRIIVRKR